MLLAGCLAGVRRIECPLRCGRAARRRAGGLLIFFRCCSVTGLRAEGVLQRRLELLATINPVTYVLEGMRSLVLEGWGDRSGTP
jgi:hypothetical protein